MLSRTVPIRCGGSSRWINRLLYGAHSAPLFGLWGADHRPTDAERDDGGDTAQVLYCRALLHASGGGRLARDWVAGLTAIACPSETLLRIALKHNATEEDVERYREYLLAARRTAVPGEKSDGDRSGPRSSGDGGGAATPSLTSSSSLLSREEEDAAADVDGLGDTPEVRCFVYDAVRAACFHRCYKVPKGERERLYVVARRLGMDDDTTRSIWRLVEREGAIEREKQRVLDYPWSD